MRLYPPGYVIDRIAIESVEFEGHKFTKDSLLSMSIYELHGHPDFWGFPEEFKPDRFDPENKKGFSNHYCPFGAGPRMCVGSNFSMYEMILTIAEILKKYRLTTPLETVEINPMISLKPRAVPIKFVKR